MSLKPRYVDFNPTWEKLTATMQNVITSLPVKRNIWNDCFTDVYSLCTSCPEPLTTELYDAIKVFLVQHVTSLYETIESSNDLLMQYHRYWMEYKAGAEYLDLLFVYLNEQHIKKLKQTRADIDFGYSASTRDPPLEIGELALDTWRAIMIETLGERLVAQILRGVDADREDRGVNRSVAKGVIHSFVTVQQYKRKNPLKLYEELFENKYLEKSGEYYRRKSNEFMKDQNCSVYMEKVLLLLIEEEMRSSNFLHSSSYSKVAKECRQRMISDHLQFLHSECTEMIRLNNRKDLQHIYTLLKAVPDGLPLVSGELQKHIELTGLQKVKGLKDDNLASNFVECILEIHNYYSDLVTECFQTDHQFIGALQRACGTIVNYKEARHPCRSPELISKYCDALLRKGARTLSENEVDDKLQNCITVFKYIEEKDLFQKFYSRNLAKRLIHGLCVSMDMEESMINRLKAAYGYDFTSKLHRMYMDIRLSLDLNNQFTEFLNGKDMSLNFNINVLQAGAWPLTSTPTPFQIPMQLTKSVLFFEQFYNEKFNGRKLTWIHHLSQAEVRVQVTSKTYFVTMSTYQLAILLLFNDADRLAFDFIVTSTNLAERELEKNIGLLVDSKILLRNKDPDSDTSFSVNAGFANKRTRFKIAVVTQRESIQEVQSTHTAVAEDRKLYLQATIVRIMKARKVLKHNELMQEVISQSRVRFSPTISMIKKSIESLIDKSYMERTPNAPDEYRYLA